MPPPNSAAAARPRSFAEALFRPCAVALIGVSDDAAKTAGRPLPFLRKHGFQGRIFPVNPHRATVQGEPALQRLGDAPVPIEHAYILVNTPAVEDAVRACAKAGVRVATILASGFAEAGSEGVARQERLLSIARSTGLRLVGPNSLGVVDTHTPMALTANAAFAADTLLKGGLSVISQSGSQIGTFVSRGAARGIGFAKLISVGNEADLTVGEIGTALADDPETMAFLLFLETIREPRHYAEFAARAQRAGKPIIAYKLGRSEVGRELAVSHTGAMIGSDAAAGAFLRHHGILRVDHLETLFEMAPLAVGRDPAARRVKSVGVVTTTGGGAAMVVDRLGMLGVEVAEPSAETLVRLNAAGVKAQPGRLLDLTLAGTRYEVMRAALDTLLEAPEFGLVLAVVGSSAQFHAELAVRPIIDCARHSKPIAVFLTPEAPHTLRLLAEYGVAAFRTPEACADGIAAYFGWNLQPQAIRPDAPLLAAAQRVLDSAGGPVLNEERSLALLEALGIPATPRVVIPPSGAIPSLPFPFPVAVKILSADITHKSDLGGVALGVPSREQLEEKRRQLISALRAERPEARLEGVLVQPMESGVGEVILGFRRDPQIGPLVMVGIGGTLAEIYQDTALRVAPVSELEAAEMIGELRGTANLRGFRGRPAGDLDALARAIVQMSFLAELPGSGVAEAEINPLIVRAQGAGVVAVDGVVRRSEPRP